MKTVLMAVAAALALTAVRFVEFCGAMLLQSGIEL